MNIALSTPSGLFEPLQHLKRWWAGCRAPSTRAANLPHRDVPQCATQARAANALMAVAAPQFRSSGMPLRVVRVVEAGQTRASVGRMVISGRMADVCAELDRLVDKEAALS